MNDVKTIRSSVEFAEELNDMKLKRIKNGQDEKLQSDRRLTIAIIRHENFKKIKKDIIEANLKEK